MRKDITADSKNCKRPRNYYKKLYTHKFGNLDKKDTFLERQTTKTHSRGNKHIPCIHLYY